MAKNKVKRLYVGEIKAKCCDKTLPTFGLYEYISGKRYKIFNTCVNCIRQRLSYLQTKLPQIEKEYIQFECYTSNAQTREYIDKLNGIIEDLQKNNQAIAKG